MILKSIGLMRATYFFATEAVVSFGFFLSIYEVSMDHNRRKKFDLRKVYESQDSAQPSRSVKLTKFHLIMCRLIRA